MHISRQGRGLGVAICEELGKTVRQARMQLDQQEQKKRNAAEAAARRPELGADATGPGYLSRSRVATLNDLSVDLSAELSRPPKPLLAHAFKIAPEDLGLRPQGGGSGRLRGVSAASPNDRRRFERGRGGGARGAAAVVAAADPAAEASNDAEVAAAELAQYEQLRREYSLWTSCTAAVVTAACYFLYSRVRPLILLCSCDLIPCRAHRTLPQRAHTLRLPSVGAASTRLHSVSSASPNDWRRFERGRGAGARGAATVVAKAERHFFRPR
jgi:hypothetical protein